MLLFNFLRPKNKVGYIPTIGSDFGEIFLLGRLGDDGGLAFY